MRAVWSWLVVTLVGVLVVVLVFALGLFGRLSAGQAVLDDVGPILTKERVDGAAAGVGIVSDVTDLVDPVVTTSGGAADEVGKLVTFVSTQTGLSQAAVLTTLQANFPKTTALLQTVPFETVAKELPGLIQFLATTLKLTPDQVSAAIQQNFPKLGQAIANLPKMTAGWNNVPGATGFTRFDGSPITTMPQVRDYLKLDVIPALQRQQGNATALAGRGGVGFLAPLLLILGIIVIVFGVLMMFLSARNMLNAGIAQVAWGVVIAVGALVVVLVFALNLFGRLGGGNDLIKDTSPIFTSERVAGAKAGVAMISTTVDTADPVVLKAGGGSDEVGKLVSFVSTTASLPPAAVLTALKTNAPNTTALLTAIPLEDVTTELPKLITFLSTTLKLSEAQVTTAVGQNFPKLGQVIGALPKVTGVWASGPPVEFTRVNGAPVNTVPEVRDYFAQDVIPVLERQQANFQKLEDPWPPVNVFPPLLLVVGIVVILFGLIMLIATRRGAGRQ
ncbi:MAG: hypothetical protein H0W01_06005 [Pseudonocardiales bacterium]|nr:hypothetical protein [Pseudonocardiales bacterium]